MECQHRRAMPTSPALDVVEGTPDTLRSLPLPSSVTPAVPPEAPACKYDPCVSTT